MTKWMMVFFLLAGGSVVFARASNPEPRWGYTPKAAQWTADVHNSLLNSHRALLNSNPKDIKRFCPAFSTFNQDQRLRFWTDLISAIAEKESDFNETETYTEAFKDSTGTHVVSRGLLQISFESAKLYGCPVSRAQDLQMAATNLDCGLRIIQRWVLKDGQLGGGQAPWRGISRYWGVFRQQRKFQQIQSAVYNSNLCRRAPTASPVSHSATEIASAQR